MIPEPENTPDGPRYEGRTLPRPDDEVVDQGAGFDLTTLVSRRAMFSIAGLGVGAALLDAVEALARSLGILTLRLETGEPQVAAIRMYERAGYRRCAPFGEYVNDPTSVCMEKLLAVE